MTEKLPRLVLAGTHSGCGKTTMTCAVLQALRERGAEPAAFKCGPDYIDPMFHSRVIGGKCCNLDLHFFDENTLRYLVLLHGRGKAPAIIEGVMGFYDGVEMTDEASTWDVAQAAAAPAVLVVDARGAARSLLAVVDGFRSLRPDSGIRGVLVNHCPPMLDPRLAQAGGERFAGAVAALGYLPPMPDCAFESRRLGLITAGEIDGLRGKLHALAVQAEKSVDLDGLLALADSAPELACAPPALPAPGEPVRIGVAMDQAFCFYYEDNLDLLRRLGAELEPFSPLADRALPEGLDGLYLGGGYPELYAQRLSQNETMRESVRAAAESGLPCIAECGGFLYLHERLGEFPMVGLLRGGGYDRGKLTRFGYVTLTAREDNLLCRAGERLPAHEFHYWEVDDPGRGFTAARGERRWECAVATPTLYAGFPHFHFYAAPEMAGRFLDVCRKEKKRRV